MTSKERAWLPPAGCTPSSSTAANGCNPGVSMKDSGSSVAVPSTLHLLNSLVDKKVPFVPAAGPGSKNITWYTCGPTVYDAAHLGHARNYLAFDIVRRVMEDYFGYQIVYVMNITDIEDKIILRARRNHIMAAYLAGEGKDTGRLLGDATAALGAEVAKRRADVEAAEASTQAELASGTGNEKMLSSLREAADSERLLLDKASAALGELQRMESSESLDREKVLELAKDALAAVLDKEKKASVTDQEIFRAHASKWEKEFMSDMDRLGVRPPTVLTRVSEYVPEIVAYIETIVANGLGYEANSSVYFDTQAFTKAGHSYGKLNPWAVGSALSEESGNANEGDGVSGEKRHKCDFALWKAAKPGEPTWDSPWGKGRPGWHIECSAMASSIIGQTVDIHSGGEDLRFPHHDNELAQAEAYYHCQGCHQWVNYFLHSGHLGIEGLKMSKSLKNFVTIKESLEVFTPRQLRLMMALNPWDRRMAYGPQLQEEVKAKESQLKNFFSNIDVALRKNQGQDHPEKWHAEELALSEACRAAADAVDAAFLDSIDTRSALNACFDLIKHMNVYLAGKTGAGMERPAQPMLLRQVAALVSKTLSVMGLTPFTFDRIGMEDLSGGAEDDGKLSGVLNALSQFRDSVRSHAKSGAPSKSFLDCCDCFRDDALVECGVRLEDTSEGSVWKLEDPAVLRQEREEKQATALTAARRKIASKADALKKEIVKFTTIQELPSIEEALASKYSKFGDDGYPTHDAEGTALEGKALDKGKKDVEKARKARLPLQKKISELGPNFLEGMRGTLSKLEDEMHKLHL